VNVTRRGLYVTMAACVLAGCGDGSGGSGAAATADNPQAGLDAMKKLKELQGSPRDIGKKAKAPGQK
jgi:hypothetical protein